jgi:hypothetical protein
MQLNQQSRWQSWMRMLALDIRPLHDSARSVGSPLLAVFVDHDATTNGRTSIDFEHHSLHPRKNT